MEEISELEETAVEIEVERKNFKMKKFVSGVDDHRLLPSQEEISRLVECAIAGCIGAKYTLTDPTKRGYGFREVSVGGKVVTTKGDGWFV